MSERSDQFDLPGVAPSRQQRSRETTAALLAAGTEMLKSRSLSELSIGNLCAEVGATVGAFYSRFESKEAYVNALIALAVRDAEEGLRTMQSATPPADAGLAAHCRLLVAGLVGWMRRHEGVLRAALQHDDTRPDRWSPFKDLAKTLTAGVTPVLLTAMNAAPARPRASPRSRPMTSTERAETTRRIAFGMQVVLGTLVNAILNDPGPLSLADRAMVDQLGHCLTLLLQAPTAAPPTTAPNRRRRR